MLKTILFLVIAQTPSPAAEVRYLDGSVIRATIDAPAVEVQTKYGPLIVPIGDIHRIECGVAWHPGQREKLTRALNDLGSTVHKDRDAATKELVDAGPAAWFLLKEAEALTAGDPEQQQRLKQVLARIKDTVSPDLLNRALVTTVHTQGFAVVGSLKSPTIKATTPHFGSQDIKLADVRSIVIRGAEPTEFEVDAATHSGYSNTWLDTNISLQRGDRLIITASGAVDIWPQGPGQYVVTPKGYTTNARNASVPAGALLGRIGEHGATFVVGERDEFTAHRGDGRLYLQVASSAWPNGCTGAYRVKVQVIAR